MRLAAAGQKTHYMKKILIPLLGLCIGCASCKETPTATPTTHEKSRTHTTTTSEPITSSEPTASTAEEPTVWVCQSSGATRYHLDRNCHGLRRCGETIEKTTATAAEKIGLTLCKYED